MFIHFGMQRISVYSQNVCRFTPIPTGLLKNTFEQRLLENRAYFGIKFTLGFARVKVLSYPLIQKYAQLSL